MEQKLGAQLDRWLSRLPFKACNVPGNVSNASGNASNATGNETNVTGHVCGSFDTNFVRAPYQHCNASEVDARFVPDYGHRAGHALCWPSAKHTLLAASSSARSQSSGARRLPGATTLVR